MTTLYAYSFDVGDDALDNEHLVLIAPDFENDPEGFMRAVIACPKLYGIGREVLRPFNNGHYHWGSRCKVVEGAWAHSYGKSSDD